MLPLKLLLAVSIGLAVTSPVSGSRLRVRLHSKSTTCEDGQQTIGVAGWSHDGCVKTGNVCVAQVSDGDCPDGSVCSLLETGVYGCSASDDYDEGETEEDDDDSNDYDDSSDDSNDDDDSLDNSNDYDSSDDSNDYDDSVDDSNDDDDSSDNSNDCADSSDDSNDADDSLDDSNDDDDSSDSSNDCTDSSDDSNDDDDSLDDSNDYDDSADDSNDDDDSADDSNDYDDSKKHHQKKSVKTHQKVYCPNGQQSIGVVGWRQDGCVASGNVCVANTNGACPSGAYCTKLNTGVYGCKAGSK